MVELWREAERRAREFDAAALAYHRYRPRYPEALFDGLMTAAEIEPQDRVLEIGAGTGIATRGLVERGLSVTATEPSVAMLEIGRSELGDQVAWHCARFEDLPDIDPVRLVLAFNAWHWVEPTTALDQVASVLQPGGSIALIWTEVVSWGESPFEQLLVEATGSVWPKTIQSVLDTRRFVENDGRFGAFAESRFQFDRALTADEYVALTRTYGGNHTVERDKAIRDCVQGCGGSVTKVEDAVLFLAPIL